jgi:hypothetical protein
MAGRSCVVAVTAVLGGVLLSGCATFKDTAAQDLARARIERCKRFPSVTPQEVRSDGTITVLSYGAGSVSEYAAWRQCMDEALAEQKKAGRLPPDAQPSIIDIRGR